MKPKQSNIDKSSFLVLGSFTGLVGVVFPFIDVETNVNVFFLEFIYALLFGIAWALAVILFERSRYLRQDISSQFRTTPLWQLAYLVCFFVWIFFDGEVFQRIFLLAFGVYFIVLTLFVFMIRKNQRIHIF